MASCILFTQNFSALCVDCAVYGASVAACCVALSGGKGAACWSVSYKRPSADANAEAKGSWDGWKGTKPLSRKGNTWHATLNIPAGTYTYHYIIDGESSILTSAPYVIIDKETQRSKRCLLHAGILKCLSDAYRRDLCSIGSIPARKKFTRIDP